MERTERRVPLAPVPAHMEHRIVPWLRHKGESTPGPQERAIGSLKHRGAMRAEELLNLGGITETGGGRRG